MPAGNISDSSRRIAKNTVLLYFRMFVLMVVGLFTSRIVLQKLGVDDFGVYGAVGGVVAMFTVVTASLSNAIGRYMTFSLGKGDVERLRRVFSTSVTLQLILCAVILILTETVGRWYLHSVMVIPEGRMGAAGVVLQCSMLILMANLLSVPYNAAITAHEHFGAYAWISMVEAVLKLSVALALSLGRGDSLVLYAFLMLAVAVAVRFVYAIYSRRHFPESRGGLVFDRELLGEMSGFAGWNFLGSGTVLVNTQGINLLVNAFFGVGMNAARGVAAQVESMVKQFAVNIAVALNPQITKSYASGNRDYSYEIVCKGSKYYFMVLLVLALPFIFEAGLILDLWLDKVPPMAPLFTKLTLLCFLVDFTPNSLITIELANGKIRRYYLLTSALVILVFPLSWIMFVHGAPAWVPYVLFIVIYFLKAVLMLALVSRDTGLPVRMYLGKAVLPMVMVAVPTVAASYAVCAMMDTSIWRLLVLLVVETSVAAGSAWFMALTPGEKAFVREKLRTFARR